MLDTHITIVASKEKNTGLDSISTRGSNSERLSSAVCPHIPRLDSSHQVIHLDSAHDLGLHEEVLRVTMNQGRCRVGFKREEKIGTMKGW